MSRLLTKAPALAFAAALIAAAPAAAHDHGGPGGGPGGDRGASAAPRKVVTQARMAARAFDRAGERIDDGDTAKALSQLAAARRHLASAQRTALKKLSTDAGPGGIAVLLNADAAVAEQTAELLDEQSGDVVDALAKTIDAALDGRDAAVAAVTALDDTAEADFAGALDVGSGAIDDELDGYAGALDDDTLTDAAKTELTDATKQATAAKAAIDARVTALDGAGASDDGEDDGGGDGWDGPPHPALGGGRF